MAGFGAPNQYPQSSGEEVVTSNEFHLESAEAYRLYNFPNAVAQVYDSARRQAGSETVDHHTTDSQICDIASNAVADSAMSEDAKALTRIMAAGATHDIRVASSLLQPVLESGRLNNTDRADFEAVVGNVHYLRGAFTEDSDKARAVVEAVSQDAFYAGTRRPALRGALLAYLAGASAEFPEQSGAGYTMQSLVEQAGGAPRTSFS
ncbi:MAG TPA: hypothetical protein VFH39_03815 [Candidatus Saccharimonadales bacterium]|nr:hypothetical protein [Candidatus Saccharimonadales bacterium]